jgi:tetratricopeptide (TPR) repeat protein
MADMPDFDGDGPEDRLTQEAEELMRQRRYHDAATRYQALRRQLPTDLWASLGHVSALECAGKIDEAEKVLEEATLGHRGSAPLHRFRHMFFVRREDLRGAAVSQRALLSEVVNEGPDDQLADLYFNQGRYHEALAELDRLLKDGGSLEDDLRASVIARLGACLRQGGQHEQARERLLQALALDPQNHWTLSELAEAERGLGNIDGARSRYLEALKVNGNDHWTRGHLAQLEFEEGNVDRAAKLYEEILASDPKAGWAKVELAQVLADQDPARAIELSKAALDSDPSNPWANAQLGNLARKQGRLEEARGFYQQALAGSPNATWILHELADLCRHIGRLEEAYAHLEHARSMDPYNATTFGYFADLLRHEGRPEEAQANLEKAVEIDPEYAWAWRELAELRALTGRHADAEEAYRKACQLEPEEPINDGLRAFLLRCQDRREAAIPYLERAVERQPDYLWAWREQIEYHLVSGRPADAERVAQRGLVALPQSAPLLGILAEAQRRLGKRAEAMVHVDKALALAEDAPQLWAIKAELAVENEDLATARTAAEKALKLDQGPDYKALFAQVLLASSGEGAQGQSDREHAEALSSELLRLEKPIQAAFEITAALAERRGDLEQAKRICDAALAGPHARDPRLLLRRARLALLSAEGDATSRLDGLFRSGQEGERRGPMPWRELAHVYAQAHQGLEARRAAYLLLASAPVTARDQSRAWLTLAEVEFALGQAREAGEALAQSLALDADCVPAHILGAVLADQREDLPAAIRHLVHLDQRLFTGSSSEPDPGLLRQLALLHERNQDPAAAGQTWARVLAHPRHTPLLQADACAFQVRHGRRSEVEEQIKEAIQQAPASAPEVQRLLRDLAQQAARSGGSPSAAKELLAHEERLGTGNRVLLAEFAIANGDFSLARRQLERARADEPRNRHVRLLHARCLLGAHELREAESEARRLWEEQRADEPACVLVAECLALRERYAEAAAVLADAALPERCGLERGLLRALLAFETESVHHGLALLGRVAVPTAQPPLVRVLAAAFPGSWATPQAGEPVRRDDLYHIPPFPRLASRLACELARQRRDDLAAALLLAVARVLETRGDGGQSRELRAQSAPALARDGHRWEALGEAWRARSLTAMAQSLLAWRRGR